VPETLTPDSHPHGNAIYLFMNGGTGNGSMGVSAAWPSNAIR